MIYLAIDPGEHCGLAVLEGPMRTEPRRIDSETLHMPKAARDGLDLSAYIKALHRLPRPDYAAIEHPFLAMRKGVPDASTYETQLRAVVMWRLAVFETWGIDAETPYPSEWQSVIHNGVPGLTTKDKSDLFVKGKFGHTCKRSDEADALCIAFWLSTRYGWPMLTPTRNDGKDGTRRAMAAAMARKCPGPEVLTMLEDMERARAEKEEMK
jgi:Holliday junction resolvasome RuvABC endonuclease subunit